MPEAQLCPRRRCAHGVGGVHRHDEQEIDPVFVGPKPTGVRGQGFPQPVEAVAVNG